MGGTPTVDNTAPGGDGGDGEVLLDEEVVQPAGLEDVHERAHAAHHTTCQGRGEKRPVGEGVEGEVVGAVQRDDGVEDTEEPLVAELADQGDHHQVVETQLGGGSALDF